MRTSFLPFARPSISDEDIQAVVQMLQSGWITTGSQCAALPETEYNSERICPLPLFPDMTDGDVDDVLAAVRCIVDARFAVTS